MAGWARGWRDYDLAAFGGYEVADEVVRELIARFGHGEVVPRTTDKPTESARPRETMRILLRQGGAREEPHQ